MEDLNLDDLYEGMDLEDDQVASTGTYIEKIKGKHPNAALEEVVEQPRGNYGYSIRLKVDLNGIGGGKPFSFFANLPHTNGDAERSKRDQNRVSSIAHAAGLYVVGGKNKKVPFVDDDATYERVVTIFRAAIGRNMPLDIKPWASNPEKANVWGITSKKRG